MCLFIPHNFFFFTAFIYIKKNLSLRGFSLLLLALNFGYCSYHSFCLILASDHGIMPEIHCWEFLRGQGKNCRRGQGREWWETAHSATFLLNSSWFRAPSTQRISPTSCELNRSSPRLRRGCPLAKGNLFELTQSVAQAKGSPYSGVPSKNLSRGGCLFLCKALVSFLKASVFVKLPQCLPHKSLHTPSKVPFFGSPRREHHKDMSIDLACWMFSEATKKSCLLTSLSSQDRKSVV